MTRTSSALALLAAATLPLGAQQSTQQSAPQTHRLQPTPQTVVWGYYDAAAKPVLRINSGDVVVVGTIIAASPDELVASGVPESEMQPETRHIRATVKKGPGGHILTGPIYVAGADSGDVLEIRLQKIDLALPYAYVGFAEQGSFMNDDFPYRGGKLIPLDRTRMLGRFAPGVEIPLHPFFGSVGVAPPKSMGQASSRAPAIYGGNLDNKDLVVGSTLYLPVFNSGALLEIGDGHAGQGDGEISGDALETGLVGTFQVIVRKDMHLDRPLAETPTHWITMGMDTSLVQATKQATRGAIALLAQQGLSKDDAYMLVSTACDIVVTQLVDYALGVHVLIPKSLFTAQHPLRNPAPR